MKVFIGGARSIVELPPIVKNRLQSIYQKGFTVLVGDCYGVDCAVQKFYANKNHKNVTIYACNGKARNNIGRWNTKNTTVSDSVSGFDFYKQKDLAMANDADYGFMIWDGNSRGTHNNIVSLIGQNKTTLVYLSPENKFFTVKTSADLNAIYQFNR